MKTNSLMLGAAVLMLATACSNDEVVKVAEDSHAIGFNSFINKSTRGEDNTTTSLKSFSVYGVTTGTTGTITVFKDQEVTKSDAGAWGYSPVKYWVSGNTYTFGAIAPAAAAKVEQNQEMARGGIQNLTFTNENGDVDLLYADDTAEGKQVVNGETYEFNFGHILSRVKFQFTNLIAGHALEVTEVTINGADYKAKYTPATAKWDVVDGNKTTENYTFNPDGVKALTSNASTTDPTYLIPTEGERNLNVSFKVNLYAVDATDNTKMVLVSTTPHELSGTLSNVNLESGFSYLFKTNISNDNIENDLNPIKFSAEVTPWTEVASDESFNSEKK